MASKTKRKHSSGKGGKPPTVLKLSKKAQAEVADLLKRHEAGSITGGKLETGLEEVEARLKKMSDFIFDFKNW